MKPYWKRNRSASMHTGLENCVGTGLAKLTSSVTLLYSANTRTPCRRACSSNRLVYVAAHLFHPS